MTPELRSGLDAVRTKCGSINKMAIRMGIGASSVLAYFRDGILPGFDKIPILATLSGESEERWRTLLTEAHEARARRGRHMSFSAPVKPPAMVRPRTRLDRAQYATA